MTIPPAIDGIADVAKLIAHKAVPVMDMMNADDFKLSVGLETKDGIKLDVTVTVKRS